MQIWLKYEIVHTSTFGLKFGSLSPAVTLKIRSRSPKPNQFFIMSQCYIHANLVKIHPPVHEISCKQESVTLTLTLTPTPTRSAPKTMSSSPSVGDIIRPLLGSFRENFRLNPRNPLTLEATGQQYGPRHEKIWPMSWGSKHQKCTSACAVWSAPLLLTA